MPRVPLNKPFYQPGRADELQVSSEVRVGRLENGVRFASRESSTPVATIGVYINTGSRDESAENSGITSFIEHVALMTTDTRTEFRLIRDTARLGSTIACTAGRESIAFTGQVLKPWARPVLETLADQIKRHSFIDFEMREMAYTYKKFHAANAENHEYNLLQDVHAAAYGPSSLGNPLYTVKNLKKFHKTQPLKEHVSRFFTADRIAVIGYGVDHAYLQQLVEQEFAELPKSFGQFSTASRPAARYQGGDLRMHASSGANTSYDSKHAHIALAFEASGSNGQDLLATAVLSSILGNPKGLVSSAPAAPRAFSNRLQQRLVETDIAISASSFLLPYSDSGLFGVYAVSSPSNAPRVAEGIAKEVVSLATSVSDEELHRAKLTVQNSLLWLLDSRSAYVDNLGRQLLADNVQSPQSLAAKVAQITAADVQRVAEKLAKSQPTLAASGDLAYLQRYDQISALLK